jgi:hypothetical protein
MYVVKGRFRYEATFVMRQLVGDIVMRKCSGMSSKRPAR